MKDIVTVFSREAEERAGPDLAHGPSTIGELANELILAGETNAQVLGAVRKRFPHGRTKMPSINWYRQRLRRAGQPVMTNRELRKALSEDNA